MTEIKICGINTEASLNAAISAGADYVGLVLYPKSPRNVEFEEAANLAERARGKVKVVALVVDPGPAILSVLRHAIKPDIVQLHGHEPIDLVARLRNALPGIELWKAVPVSSVDDVAEARAYLNPETHAHRLLFDAKPAEKSDLPGGNGLSFDWRILDGIADAFPFILAGGLTPENVADAIRLTGAKTVDVSSGVEVEPGKKSPELIRGFIQAAKSANTDTPSAA